MDLGSNSVHLLVGAIAGHRVHPLVDESVFLGLGSTVAEQGYLGRAERGALVATLVRYADAARRLGALTITFIGTDPIRRALDAATLVHETAQATALSLHVVTHQEEAYLTLIGVTEGMPVLHETLVVDIGGGSSEFCIVDASRRPRAAGLELGSNQLTGRFVAHDPPTPAEIAAMRASALVVARDAPEARPGEIIAVGGTASNLIKVLPAAALDRTLTRERIAEILAILATEPAAVASERHLINPIRARILPAGGVILDAILEHYGADRIRVAEAGVREGTILAVEHGGPSWRDRLPHLAHGWRV